MVAQKLLPHYAQAGKTKNFATEPQRLPQNRAGGGWRDQIAGMQRLTGPRSRQKGDETLADEPTCTGDKNRHSNRERPVRS